MYGKYVGWSDFGVCCMKLLLHHTVRILGVLLTVRYRGHARNMPNGVHFDMHCLEILNKHPLHVCWVCWLEWICCLLHLSFYLHVQWIWYCRGMGADFRGVQFS